MLAVSRAPFSLPKAWVKRLKAAAIQAEQGERLRVMKEPRFLQENGVLAFYNRSSAPTGSATNPLIILG